MASPMRIDDNLCQLAAEWGKLEKRSVPKQIEYWAEIGRRVEPFLSQEDRMALLQGYLQIKTVPVESASVNPEEVFQALEINRSAGLLAQKVTAAEYRYGASDTSPGLLERIHRDGTREPGRFLNGRFVPAES